MYELFDENIIKYFNDYHKSLYSDDIIYQSPYLDQYQIIKLLIEYNKKNLNEDILLYTKKKLNLSLDLNFHDTLDYIFNYYTSKSRLKLNKINNINNYNNYNQYDMIKIKKSDRICVLSGAGLSVALGISDYKSGISKYLQQYDQTLSGTININNILVNPIMYYHLLNKYPMSNPTNPSLGHKFIKKLYDNGNLVKYYTQNIDGVDNYLDLPDDKLIQAHGNASTCRCLNPYCSKVYNKNDFLIPIKNLNITTYEEAFDICSREKYELQLLNSILKLNNFNYDKRFNTVVLLYAYLNSLIDKELSSFDINSCDNTIRNQYKNDKEYVNYLIEKNPNKAESLKLIKEYILSNRINHKKPLCPECGFILGPNIVFYGQNLDDKFFNELENANSGRIKCDIIFIMGTPLQVSPFNLIFDALRRTNSNARVIMFDLELPSNLQEYVHLLIEGKIDESLTELGWM